jgi:hypothetical protein
MLNNGDKTLEKESNRFLCQQETTLSIEHIRINNRIHGFAMEQIGSRTVPFTMFEKLDANSTLLCSRDLEIRGGNNRIGYP